jgi:hypothetical protein
MDYRNQNNPGEVEIMQAFITAVVVAIVVGVGSVYVLDAYQKPASVAYTSPTGVRL